MLLIRIYQKFQQWHSHIKGIAVIRCTMIVMDTELASPPPMLPAPPSFPHATQVAGGLGLSLTAANYRLTRPRCALHDCISPRSGYPERGRDGEWRRERWLGRTEKDGGGRGEIESGRKDRGGEGETEEKNRRDEWEKRRGERRVSGREAYSGGTSTVD